MVDIARVQNEEGLWEVSWKFEDESFETLKAIASDLHFKPGAIIFREGDPADGMYLVLEGTANIIRENAHGEGKIVSIVRSGQSFGEIGLLVDRPRRASVAAATALHVLKISPYAIELLSKSAPDMAFMMYRALARSLAEQLLNTQEMQRPD